MRVPLTPDANEPPPPPYTRDPNAVETQADRAAVEIPIRTSLRGCYANDPHSTITQLREAFHALSQNMPAPERKDLKKKHKSEIKAVKKDVKSLIKDIKNERKESHGLRRDKCRAHLEERRAYENVHSYRGNDENSAIHRVTSSSSSSNSKPPPTLTA
ncbi:MAG: hypothetical protein Q9164_006591 [Protoblastenia rupestris]